MPLIEELTSKRSPLVKKAAKKILKDRLKGYGPYLHSALETEIEKNRAWETQMYLLYAMAATDCAEVITAERHPNPCNLSLSSISHCLSREFRNREFIICL